MRDNLVYIKGLGLFFAVFCFCFFLLPIYMLKFLFVILGNKIQYFVCKLESNISTLSMFFNKAYPPTNVVVSI